MSSEFKVPSGLILFGLLGARLEDRLAVTRRGRGSVHRLWLHLAVRILTVSRLRSRTVARLYVNGWLGLAYIVNRGHIVVTVVAMVHVVMGYVTMKVSSSGGTDAADNCNDDSDADSNW